MVQYQFMGDEEIENDDPGFPPVSDEESGQKLLQFLQRRLDLPATLLHRWMRTGQIRLNGRRVKAFERVKTGDIVRLPPFAGQIAGNCEKIETVGEPLELAGKSGNIWALSKPAGLAVHGGSGQVDSVCARLDAQFHDLPFRPVPAHRLDRDTSGILLCGASYEALTSLQGALRDHQTHKEYLAWVEGRFEDEQLLVGRLAKLGPKGREKMQISAQGKLALCLARPLDSNNDASLVQLRLLTGRTHQIRAQMAAIGHPVLGDVKYGAQKRSGGMLLHAFRVILPDGLVFTCPPPWSGGFMPVELPPVFEISPEIDRQIESINTQSANGYKGNI